MIGEKMRNNAWLENSENWAGYPEYNDITFFEEDVFQPIEDFTWFDKSQIIPKAYDKKQKLITCLVDVEGSIQTVLMQEKLYKKLLNPYEGFKGEMIQQSRKHWNVSQLLKNNDKDYEGEYCVL